MSRDTRQINVRVSVVDDNLVRELNGSWSEIMRLGFEKFMETHPEYLQEMAQKYQILYSKCIANIGKCYNTAIQKSSALDDLYKLYVSQGRNINNPSHEDKSWVKSRLGKIDNGSRISSQQFFEYCCKRHKEDKQKKLEVDE